MLFDLISDIADYHPVGGRQSALQNTDFLSGARTLVRITFIFTQLFRFGR